MPGGYGGRMSRHIRKTMVPQPPCPAVLGVEFIEVDFPTQSRPRAVVELEGGIRILLESRQDVTLAADLIATLRNLPSKGGCPC